MSDAAAVPLLTSLFGTRAMHEAFSDEARLQGMLDFEAALAASEAELGIVPHAAAAAIGLQCRAPLYDRAALAAAAALAGNLAIPLVRELTARVALSDAAAAGFVHWGATSQDAIDTGLVLQLRRALELIDADLAELVAALRTLARQERATVMAGRTWLQQAVPVTLGLKAAGWLDATLRHADRLHALRANLVVQFGGAAGTLASLSGQGQAVAARLAQGLGLGLPDIPWHAQRDRLVEIASVLGMLVGSLGKMARDVALLMQTEVGEAAEPAALGRGGSSTMPHKHNPVAAANVLAAAIRVPGLVSTLLAAMVQEHERGLGGWHAEWEVLPEIFRLTAGALAQMVPVVRGLTVDAGRMQANLGSHGGVMLAEAVTMALAPVLGRRDAHALLEKAARASLSSGQSLRSVLDGMPEVTSHLAAGQLDALLDAGHYLGSTGVFVDAVLARAGRAYDHEPDHP